MDFHFVVCCQRVVNEPKKSIAEPQDPTGYETHEDEDDDESE